MKIAILLVLALLSFGLTLVGMLAVTGNLTPEGLDRIMGRSAPAPVLKQEAKDDLDPILKTLNERAETLKKREQELDEREKQLAIRERDIEGMLDELKLTHTQFTESLDKADTDYAANLKIASESVAGMKPKGAAEVLADWPPDDAAALLRGVPERQRGKILDEMDPQDAAAILESLRARAY